MSNWILVTGGAGFVGSHTCVELLQAGYDVCIVDNLANSSAGAVRRIGRLAGRTPELHVGDLRDRHLLEAIFSAHRFEAVMHFAGLKSVQESVARPLLYYDCNVGGTISLLDAMVRHGVKRIVFSSSATVYGLSRTMPVTEAVSPAPINPYGHTKIAIESMLADLASAQAGFQAVILRCFNPIGAHESGMLGEEPAGMPNNLMPLICQVAKGTLGELSIFGNDYSTADGTAVRDYLHVMDLARANVAALEAGPALKPVTIANLGTGRGCSVLELIAAFERTVGRKISYRIVARRPGDPAASYADPSLAQKLLGWRAERGIEDMCRDTWRWIAGQPV